MQIDRISVSRALGLKENCGKKKWHTTKCVFCAVVFLSAAHSLLAQSDAPSKAFLHNSLQAFAGNQINDVVLSATASFHPGSSMGSVQASLEAISSGSTQITYASTPQSQMEVHTVDSTGIWSGAWIDANNTKHPLAQHNMMIEPAWFFPQFAVQRALNSAGPGLQIVYVGAETFRGSATQHLRIIATSSTSPLLQHLAQTELYLDAVTLLPTALTYNDHPDNNALQDIPVIIFFSNYAPIKGVLLPNHVQQLRNNALFVDLLIQNVQINTNISITPLQ